MKLTITAATGRLGTHVVSEALRHFQTDEIRLAVRNPQKAAAYAEQGLEVVKADYLQPETLVPAFHNTEILIYIPSITHPSIVRVPETENVITAAERAKVKHIIFVGFFADQGTNPFHMAPFFGYTNRRFACSSLSYTIIKNAMYTDPLIPYLPELQTMGKLIYPVPHGTISFISRAESAAAIIKAARDSHYLEKTYTLTQERNYTMPELADILTAVGGKKIAFSPVSTAAFAQKYDTPKGFGIVLASLYEAAERGLLNTVTDDFRLITGRPAKDLRTVLTEDYARIRESG
ncbi:SDR family oxidoreductase [Colibacter massiliensis]|uniref:SDR family oxidoreductase n=2 Tax=Colibacter massiliensis TaxID=1852379 RepID=UPI002357C4EC|nr:SDR family oxidoreductase [Colibacter massiliensis]